MTIKEHGHIVNPNHVFKIFKKKLDISSIDNVHLITLPKLYKENLLELYEKTKKSKVTVLVVSWEHLTFSPDSHISHELVKFIDLLKEFKIFNCDFYISSFFSNQHSKSIEYLNKNFYDWKFYDFYIDFPWHPSFKILEDLDCNNFDLFLQKSVMKFSYLNFTHRMHRKLFSKFLIKENLVKNNLVAINYNSNNNQYEEFDSKLIKKTKLIPVNIIDDWFYNKNLLQLYHDVELVFERHPNITNNSFSYIECLHNSSINIVSEAVYHYPFQNFSEKIISSLLSKRPFIIIGPHKSLEYLKSKGFKK
jgi:hypothetical protein